MTNEQLALLLDMWADRLSRALRTAEDALPDEAFEERETILGASFRCVPAHEELREILEDARDEVQDLRRGSGS